MLESLDVCRCRFRVRAVQAIEMPPYAGSMLRGGLGHALRRVVCVLKHVDCADCLLRDRCAYVTLFEAGRYEVPANGGFPPVVPQPYVIEPPLEREGRIAPGEAMEFGLLLVGPAIPYLPYLVYAFNILGGRGLGRTRGKFVLESVAVRQTEGWEEIYRLGRKSIGAADPGWNQAQVARRRRQLADHDRITFHFITPTRIKSEGRFVRRPEFHHLLRALLRRLSGFSEYYCGRPLDVDFKSLVERAEAVRREHARLAWTDRERYSFRQKRRMKLGGFSGRVTFRGEFAAFAPLLAWGEILHVGKAASFGLGKYELITI